MREPAKGLIELSQLKILNEGIVSAGPGKKLSQGEAEAPIELTLGLPVELLEPASTTPREELNYDNCGDHRLETLLALNKISKEKVDESDGVSESERLSTVRERSQFT